MGILLISYTAAGKSRAALALIIVASKRRRTQPSRRASAPGLLKALSARRGRRWSTYLISAITLLVALSMALPFCNRPVP